MAWMNQLYQTYEKNQNIKRENQIAITPVAHMYANAQIEISINVDGIFLSARKIDKEQAETLIPVTESSAGRSSGIAPHALSDTLSYIAGDYAEYCLTEKEKKTSKEKYDSYIKNLKNWVESGYGHYKIKAIYDYLIQKNIIVDLVKSGIVQIDENGKFTKEKISGQPYEKSIARFRVLNPNVDDTEKTWEDDTLINAYIKFYLENQQGRKDICYLEGSMKTISENHPKGIVAANYGAKLVSANDSQGYTFRGRFQNAEQACALSYEASQKIHSALTWLVKNQGAYIGKKEKRTFVCFSPAGKETPNVMDPLGLEEEEETNESVAYRKQMIKTLQGYQNQFETDDQIVVIGLDAATTGRLSITYYNEFFADDFFEKIISWSESCKWFFLKFNQQKKPYYVIQTPIFRQIIECAFGNEKGAFIDVNDKVLKAQVQRLLKCMLEKQNFPRDILNALIVRASMPLAYSRFNRERVLSVTCASIVKYYNDLKKGDYNSMKLDLENHDRSYLFGRLLAVYEHIERSAYDKGEGREPNAIRFQSAYVNHPMQTRMILEDAVRPYLQKLSAKSREYFRKLIGEITLSFREEDQKKLNQRLGETYLLGYYLQRAEFYKKKEEKQEESNE
jgi:CRISPR-associated protein Csd1